VRRGRGTNSGSSAAIGSSSDGTFGLAVFADPELTHLTAACTFLGTPHHCSPQQLLGETLDASDDRV